MPVTLAIETPLQDDVRRLVAELNAYLQPLSPPEFQFQMTVEQMAEPETTLFVARDEAGEAVGMGALKVHDAGLAEVKRMYTVPAVRGQGVGRLILDRIIDEARTRNIKRLALETGTEAMMPSAWRLYGRNGFTACGAFLDYPESEHNAFFEMILQPEEVSA